MTTQAEFALEIHAYSLYEAACVLLRLSGNVTFVGETPKVLFRLIPVPPPPPKPPPEPPKPPELLVSRKISLWWIWGAIKRIFRPRLRSVPKK